LRRVPSARSRNSILARAPGAEQGAHPVQRSYFGMAADLSVPDGPELLGAGAAGFESCGICCEAGAAPPPAGAAGAAPLPAGASGAAPLPAGAG